MWNHFSGIHTSKNDNQLGPPAGSIVQEKSPDIADRMKRARFSGATSKMISFDSRRYVQNFIQKINRYGFVAACSKGKAALVKEKP